MPVSQHVEDQGPGTGRPKWNAASVNVVSYTYVRQVKMSAVRKLSIPLRHSTLLSFYFIPADLFPTSISKKNVAQTPTFETQELC